MSKVIKNAVTTEGLLFYVLIRPGPDARTFHVCENCALTTYISWSRLRTKVITDPDARCGWRYGDPKTYRSMTTQCQGCGIYGAEPIILRSCGFCGGHWSGYRTAHDAPGGGDTWFCPKHNTKEKRIKFRGGR